MLRDLAVEQEVSTGKINISALSRQTGLDRKTVRKHIRSGDVPQRKVQHRGPGKLDPYKDYIKVRLNHYPQLSGIRIFEEIQCQGYCGGYTILKDYLRTTRPRPPILPEYRYETKPGVQAQVDWAECVYRLTDNTTHKTYCFSMICGYSRMRYIEFTQSMDLETFLVCHQRAFEYFGGITQEILYDNIKVVVLRRRYPSSESIFYPPFVDFKNHYGFKARLCRPYRAKTKGKIERSIRFIKDNFLYGREFCSLNDLNLQARIWMDRINNHEHGTTHEIPTKRLLKEQLTPYCHHRDNFPHFHRDNFPQPTYSGVKHRGRWDAERGGIPSASRHLSKIPSSRRQDQL